MNIFMLGWEFPPFISGGLGTACYGLTRAMNELGHHVIFVLPQPVAEQYGTHVHLKTPSHVAGSGLGLGDPFEAYTLEELENVEFRAIPSTLRPRPRRPGSPAARLARPRIHAPVDPRERRRAPAGRQPLRR